LKKIITLFSGILLFTMVAAATELPKYEVYLGYQYIRSYTFNDTFFNPITGTNDSFNRDFDMHGGDGQFIYNFNNWLGGVVDAGGVNKPNVGFNAFNCLLPDCPAGSIVPGVLGVSNTMAFVYGGPRFTLRRHRHGFFGLQPFGEVLFGAAFRHLSTNVPAVTSFNTPLLPPVATPFGNLFPGPLTVVNAQLTRSDNGFSLKTGGGLDYRFNKHFSARVLQVDYILTRFPGVITGIRTNRNNLVASAGILFTWGAM
jgi:hypothetical protein